MTTAVASPEQQPFDQWLKTYYFLRAGVSVAWIILAVVIGRPNPTIGAILLVAYPAWDAFANYLDARKSGGLRSNPSQLLNFAVSVLVAIAIGCALTVGIATAIEVFGAWAIASGLLQLVTAIRRWKTSSGQWAMILSGVQSAAAGLFFFQKASSGIQLDVTTVAPYAGVGALYFLISAVWLTVRHIRQRSSALAR